ncbi:glycosyltransferase [Cobetia marina]|uniref:glycosyltransferase n=1 Tax=Cobetia marina TaxID=28258 RepID=UPI003857BEB4
MPKLCFVFNGFFYGGAERQLIYICNGLAERGLDVTILCLKRGEAYKDLLSSNVKVVEPHYNYSFIKTLRYFSDIIKKENPEMVISFLFQATLISRIFKLFYRYRHITSYRNTTYGSFLRDKLMLCTSFLDNYTTGNSNNARIKLTFRSRWDKFVSIPNISKVAYARSSDEIERSDFYFIGRLEKQKNVINLIYAFDNFKKANPSDKKLFIIGDGSLRGELEKLSEDLDSCDNIIFLGIKKDINEYLVKAEAIILPSLWEGMPNVLIEAMLLKTPVIATPVGSIPEMVDHLQSGIIINSTSKDEICRSLEYFLNLDKESKIKIAENAYESAKEKYSKESVINQWLALIAKS